LSRKHAKLVCVLNDLRGGKAESEGATRHLWNESTLLMPTVNLSKDEHTIAAPQSKMEVRQGCEGGLPGRVALTINKGGDGKKSDGGMHNRKTEMMDWPKNWGYVDPVNALMV